MSIKLKGSSDGSVSFDAPADTSPSGSDITLTLPTSAGSANQFLKNSGIAGELEHSSMVETSTGIGIGTSAPQTSLEIKGANTTGKGQLLVSSASAGQEARMTFIDGSDDIAEISTDGDNLYFYNERSSGAFQFYTGGSERARLDSSGRLLVGTSSASTLRTNIIPKIQTEATSATENGISLFTNVNSSSGPFLIFGKSRGTTAGSNTVVQNNDDLATLLFIGADGTDRASSGASIAAAVDGTPGSNDMPGRLVFSTTADGASSPTERLRITSDGTIRLASGCPGIDFSQIQTNASGMTSETLDKYEEGTWTPSLGGGTGSFNSDSWGRYTRIGRRVHLNCFIKISSMDDTNTTFLIAGVPFTPVDPGSGGFVGSIMSNDVRWRRNGNTSDATMVAPYMTDGTGGIRIYGLKSDNGWDSLKNVDWNTNEQAYIQISYDV